MLSMKLNAVAYRVERMTGIGVLKLSELSSSGGAMSIFIQPRPTNFLCRSAWLQRKRSRPCNLEKINLLSPLSREQFRTLIKSCSRVQSLAIGASDSNATKRVKCKEIWWLHQKSCSSCVTKMPPCCWIHLPRHSCWTLKTLKISGRTRSPREKVC